MVPSYRLSIEIPTPLVLGVGVKFAPWTLHVTFVLIGQWRSGNSLLRSVLIKIARRLLALQALFHLHHWLLPERKLLREFRALGLLLLLPALQVGRGSRRGLKGHLVLCVGGLPPLPLDLGPARVVGVPLGSSLVRAGALPLLLLLRERAKWELPARSRLPLPAPLPRLSLPIPHRMFNNVLSSRGSRSSDRGARKDKRARSRTSSSLSSSRSRSRGRERRLRSSSRSLSSRARSRRDWSWSFDRGRLPGSSARSRAEEPGRLARRETQEGVGAVASQPPAVSEAAVAVTPVAGGAALTALPSAVQDLARFFLSLSGSSSLGAIGGIAGVTGSAAGSGGAVCPPTDAGGAVTTCTTAVTPTGAGVSPAAPTAFPGVSGEQQRNVESHSRGRRSRSSSEGTDRRAKKRARRRSPSPGPSSCCRGRHYRSSSDSSDEDQADASPPRSGRAHGGAPGGASSSRAYDRSPRPGTSRSYARDDRYRSGAGRRSPAPSGVADDDRSSAFESVDFDRDDSFRSVLGLIRSFHGMEEPAGVPSARCKTSLASAYGLMSEVSLAFTLPASPLVRSLLDDTNLDLPKFLEDQTVHGFLPVPGRCHRSYYRTSSSSFPGPYTVPPGVTSITLEKVSEANKRSVALSASQVSSMEAMLSGVCEVSSWLDWWLSTCGGF